MEKLIFNPGNNIAIKIPLHQYEQTLHFYRDILLLEVEEQVINHPIILRSVKIKFGAIDLWLDAIHGNKEAKIYLELSTNHIQDALNFLKANKIQMADGEEEEILREDEHWIKDPAGNILHLYSLISINKELK